MQRERTLEKARQSRRAIGSDSAFLSAEYVVYVMPRPWRKAGATGEERGQRHPSCMAAVLFRR
jgi:hypothetical protein